MIKSYILDTCTLLSFPDSLYAFEENTVIIPIGVIEELDKFKKDVTELGRNARQVSRELDSLRKLGDLREGVKIPTGGKIAVRYNGNLKSLYKEKNVDLHVIHIAQETIKKDKTTPCIIVTLDVNVRIRANALGLQAEGYEKGSLKKHELDKGHDDLDLDEDLFDEFVSKKQLAVDKIKGFKPSANYYYTLRNEKDTKRTMLARVSIDKTVLGTLIGHPTGSVIKARNREQAFLIDALMDKDIKLVSVVGTAGTGKTLVSLAMGYYQTTDEKAYKRLLVSRPIYPMGKDIGFLPGPQPLDAKILTPSGWTTMGNLKIGDYVISRDGRKTKVTGIYDKGMKDIYKVTTTENSSAEACLDHLWITQTHEDKKRKRRGTVKTTKQIIESLRNKDNKINHYLPRNEPVEFEQKIELPIPPYLFGCLLGDGYFGSSISLHNADKELVDRAIKEASEIGCELKYYGSISYGFSSGLYNNKPARRVLITNEKTNESIIYRSIGQAAIKNETIGKGALHDRCTRKVKINGFKYEFLKNNNRWEDKIKEKIGRLGLLGKRSWEKYIPDIYLCSSLKNRIDLLRGLMDTDGHCKKNKYSYAGFTTTSEELARDVMSLVRSLGGRVGMRERDRIGRGAIFKGRKIISRRKSYEIGVSLPEGINPFFISRKSKKYNKIFMQKVGIKSIELSGKKRCQCIMVENPEHLYITNDYIVTHNTVEEKLDPWMCPIYDALEIICESKEKNTKNKKEITGRDIIKKLPWIMVEPLTYIRGRSIHNQFMLIDESQNLSPLEIKTIITRAGEDTKIVLTGDIYQIDNPYIDSLSNGLSVTMESFRGSHLAAGLILERGVRSELAEEATEKL